MKILESLTSLTSHGNRNQPKKLKPIQIGAIAVGCFAIIGIGSAALSDTDNSDTSSAVTKVSSIEESSITGSTLSSAGASSNYDVSSADIVNSAESDISSFAPMPSSTAPAVTSAPSASTAASAPSVSSSPLTSVASTTPVSSASVEKQEITVTNNAAIPAGSNATISIHGAPNTEYSIAVYYSSGKSKAEGLHAKTSDASGNVSWTWKVGTKTKPGTYKVIIVGGNQTIETSITVQ